MRILNPPQIVNRVLESKEMSKAGFVADRAEVVNHQADDLADFELLRNAFHGLSVRAIAGRGNRRNTLKEIREWA